MQEDLLGFPIWDLIDVGGNTETAGQNRNIYVCSLLFGNQTDAARFVFAITAGRQTLEFLRINH